MNLAEADVDKKANMLLQQIRGAVNKYIPEKARKIAGDDKSWYTQPLKKLDRRRRREFARNRKSSKYLQLNQIYEKKLSKAKKKYKRDMIDNIKSAKGGSGTPNKREYPDSTKANLKFCKSRRLAISMTRSRRRE